MDATCANCGTTFTARRSTAQYCTAKCRKRAADLRARVPVVRLAPRLSPTPDVAGIGTAMLTSFTRSDLETPRGQVALRLARDVDDAPPLAPGLAALVRELRSTLDQMEAAQAPAKANPLTLIRERHAGGRSSG